MATTAEEAIDLLIAEGAAVQVERDVIREKVLPPAKQRAREKIAQERWFDARDAATPARDRLRLAFAVLAECERLRISALGHGWQGDVELLEGIINRATAAARLEAKPDGR